MGLISSVWLSNTGSIVQQWRMKKEKQEFHRMQSDESNESGVPAHFGGFRLHSSDPTWNGNLIPLSHWLPSRCSWKRRGSPAVPTTPTVTKLLEKHQNCPPYSRSRFPNDHESVERRRKRQGEEGEMCRDAVVVGASIGIALYLHHRYSTPSTHLRMFLNLQTGESVSHPIIIHMFHLTFNMQSHTVPQPESAYRCHIITRTARYFVLVYWVC
ncbi:unnamed protein product [Tetraodon nigroviridis]|uniref:(spotted green pufferfish) hypothetical protein n=1 Tax=Tetraodon nigroviridis TaxID=99883 RepID=Q4T8M6_TETNG|nr:unnamed protein product [Tetraodon nigroviridis]